MSEPVIVWSDTPPKHPAGGAECGLSCRAVWHQVHDPATKGKGWRSHCDKRGCPHADRKPQGRAA